MCYYIHRMSEHDRPSDPGKTSAPIDTRLKKLRVPIIKVPKEGLQAEADKPTEVPAFVKAEHAEELGVPTQPGVEEARREEDHQRAEVLRREVDQTAQMVDWETTETSARNIIDAQMRHMEGFHDPRWKEFLDQRKKNQVRYETQLEGLRREKSEATDPGTRDALRARREALEGGLLQITEPAVRRAIRLERNIEEKVRAMIDAFAKRDQFFAEALADYQRAGSSESENRERTFLREALQNRSTSIAEYVQFLRGERARVAQDPSIGFIERNFRLIRLAYRQNVAEGFVAEDEKARERHPEFFPSAAVPIEPLAAPLEPAEPPSQTEYGARVLAEVEEELPTDDEETVEAPAIQRSLAPRIEITDVPSPAHLVDQFVSEDGDRLNGNVSEREQEHYSVTGERRAVPRAEHIFPTDLPTPAHFATAEAGSGVVEKDLVDASRIRTRTPEEIRDEYRLALVRRLVDLEDAGGIGNALEVLSHQEQEVLQELYDPEMGYGLPEGYLDGPPDKTFAERTQALLHGKGEWARAREREKEFAGKRVPEVRIDLSETETNLAGKLDELLRYKDAIQHAERMHETARQIMEEALGVCEGDIVRANAELGIRLETTEQEYQTAMGQEARDVRFITQLGSRIIELRLAIQEIEKLGAEQEGQAENQEQPAVAESVSAPVSEPKPSVPPVAPRRAPASPPTFFGRWGKRIALVVAMFFGHPNSNEVPVTVGHGMEEHIDDGEDTGASEMDEELEVDDGTESEEYDGYVTREVKEGSDVWHVAKEILETAGVKNPKKVEIILLSRLMLDGNRISRPEKIRAGQELDATRAAHAAKELAAGATAEQLWRDFGYEGEIRL